MNKKLILGVSILALPIMSLFQNCSGQGFKEQGTASFASSAGTLEDDMPVSINMPLDPKEDEDSSELQTEASEQEPTENSEGVVSSDCQKPPMGSKDRNSVQVSENIKCSDDNRFTVVHENAEVLICNKQIFSITAIEPGAKVVIVNGSIDKITSIDANAKLILVNSNLGKPRAYKGDVINLDNQQGKDYLDLCEQNSEAMSGGDVLPIYQGTHLTSNNVSDVPDETSMIKVTSVDNGVVLTNKKTNYFKATAIGESAQIKIKAARFRMTSVSKNSVLQLY